MEDKNVEEQVEKPKTEKEAAPKLRLEWLEPDSLTSNPQNWRIHPQIQKEALTALLDEVGWVGAALYNEATGHLIDGHLRRDEAGARGEPIPVLVGSWTEEQEKLILATLDPIAGQAEADATKLTTLLAEVAVESEAIHMILAQQKAEANLADLMADLEASFGDSVVEGVGRPVMGSSDQQKLITTVVWVDDLADLEKAILMTGNPNRGEAIMEICRAYLDGQEG